MNDHLKSIRKVAPSYAGLVHALVQLSTSQDVQSDQGLVADLIALIDRLRLSLIAARDLDIENEGTLQNNHNDFLTAIDAQIDGYEGTINSLQSNIDVWGPQL